MEIVKGVEIVDLALKYKDMLILGDVQLGYEESLHAYGFFVPRFNVDEVIRRLEKIFARVSVSTVIVNGDIKHEFGRISRSEWNDTLRFLDYLAAKVQKIILVRGNHDIFLGPLAKKRNIEVVEYVQDGDVTILHGHNIIPNLTKIIIIGHEHPAVSFREKPYAKFKCFLKGRWHNKTLIVMPSFTSLTEGSDVTREEVLSPFLEHQDLGEYEVFVVEECNETEKRGSKLAEGNVLYFGKLRELQGL